MKRDEAPDIAEARAVGRVCGACGGLLAHEDAWRCPWVKCRAWLRGTTDEPAQLARTEYDERSAA